MFIKSQWFGIGESSTRNIIKKLKTKTAVIASAVMNATSSGVDLVVWRNKLHCISKAARFNFGCDFLNLVASSHSLLHHHWFLVDYSGLIMTPSPNVQRIWRKRRKKIVHFENGMKCTF